MENNYNNKVIIWLLFGDSFILSIFSYSYQSIWKIHIFFSGKIIEYKNFPPKIEINTDSVCTPNDRQRR